MILLNVGLKISKIRSSPVLVSPWSNNVFLQGFTPKTDIAVPKTGFCFYCAHKNVTFLVQRKDHELAYLVRSVSNFSTGLKYYSLASVVVVNVVNEVALPRFKK